MEKRWTELQFLIAGLALKWDTLSHKSVLSIAAAIITILVYWGFTATFKQLDRLELGQTNITLQVHEANLKMIAENAKQDLCITEIKTKQDVVIQTLRELHPNGMLMLPERKP